MTYEGVAMNEIAKMEIEDHPTVKLYRTRWVVVTLYSLLSGVSAIHWVQYSIIANIIMKYYGVTSVAVDWTSMISMITYPPLIVPATYLIDKIGLRYCTILGAVGTAAGSWIRVFSIRPHLFWVGFVGQAVVFMFQVFIFGMSSKVAAVWFGPNEISTACAIGLAGSQIGAALSFILPPLIVQNHDNLDDIGRELSYLMYGTCALTTSLVPLIFLFFKDKPEFPPSKAQAQVRSTTANFSTKEFRKSYKSLLTNKPFIVLAICFGTKVGVFSAICTLLNQIVLAYFENAEKDAGAIGLLMLVIGTGGVMIFGFILDKTKKFKENAIILYVLTTFGVVAFMVALETRSKVLVYISSCIIGFFHSAYFPVGLEFAVELSFPQPESTTSGILVSVGQLSGVIHTLLLGQLLARFGTFWALSAMIGFLIVGSLASIFIPNILLRQEALGITSEKKSFLSNNKN